MRRRVVVRVALASATLTLLLAPSPGRAETPSNNPGAPNAPVGMHLEYQTPWVSARDQFVMLLRVDNPSLIARPGAAVLINVYQRATTRTAFDRVIANQGLGGRVATPSPLAVSSLPRYHGDLVVALGLQGSDASPGIAISQPGVYPVEVSLTNTGTPTSSFVTWLVVVETRSNPPIDKPLMVSLIWQLVADPATLPDGSADPGVIAQMRRGGRLDRIATLLGRAANPTGGAPRVPMSLIAGPETLETWSKLVQHDTAYARGFELVRAAARRPTTDLLPAPYVPIDGPAFEAAGFGDHLPEEYLRGADTLHQVLGATPFDRAQTAFVDPADDAAVERLRRMLVTRIAVRDPVLQPVTHPYTPDQGFVLQTSGGSSEGVATAPFVEQLFDGPDAAAVKAARVVAALAEAAYEQPSVARGLVLAPPARWTPDLTTMTTVLDALRGFPLVQPVTLDELFAQISHEQTSQRLDVERQLQATTPPATPLSTARFDAAADQLHAYESVAGVDDPIAVEGERRLLLALSTSITTDRATQELAKIDTSVRSFTSAIKVDAKRITLTAKRASIPLTFENNLRPARALKVRVRFESPKLLFPGGAEQVVTLDPGTTAHQFKVEARASGTFPMRITLTSQDGRLSFGEPVQVTVRSAVFGGFAVALTIGALVFLAGWWGNHFRRTRRARRLTPAAAT